MTRRALAGAAALGVSGCGPRVAGLGPALGQPMITPEADALVMPDGFRLPLRAWLPEAPPRAVLLGLHGFNDHAGAWQVPSALFTDQGFALYAYDQRGFGATASRGLWPGTEALVADATQAAALVRGKHPGLPLVVMGESMGAAVLLVAGRSMPADAWVLLAPAVWGRGSMNALYRGVLWALSGAVPSMAVSGANPVTKVTDDEAVLQAMRKDTLLIRATRMDAVSGLVDLMDDAVAAAPVFDPGPALLLWAGRDDLVPGSATSAFVQRLPPAPPARRTLRHEPGGYHLLLRDTGRAARARAIGLWLDDALRAGRSLG
jgi:alpha-beta hydrolase superfamily lysophospholipase